MNALRQAALSLKYLAADLEKMGNLPPIDPNVSIVDAIARIRLLFPERYTSLAVTIENMPDGTSSAMFSIWDGTTCHMSPSLKKAITMAQCSADTEEDRAGSASSALAKLEEFVNPLPY